MLSNILIIGCGAIGRRHLNNIIKSPKASFDSIIIVEPNKHVHGELSKLNDAIQIVPTVEQALLLKSDISVAIVCTPNNLHAPLFRILAERNIHLFIEKPLALSIDEIDSLREVFERSTSLVMVGCNLRFHPAVKQMRQVITDELLGKLWFAHASFGHYLPNWRPGTDYLSTYSAKSAEGGGILLDAIHEPDYLCYLLGYPVAVNGTLKNLGVLSIDVEEYGMYVIEHENGCVSSVQVDYLRRDKLRKCEICGEKGTLRWVSEGKNPERVDVSLFNAESNSWHCLYESQAYDQNQAFVDEIEYFLDCCLSGAVPMNSYHEAARINKAVMALNAPDVKKDNG